MMLERDPYALEVMPLHLTAAVELKKKNELFLQAHRHTSFPYSWPTTYSFLPHRRHQAKKLPLLAGL